MADGLAVGAGVCEAAADAVGAAAAGGGDFWQALRGRAASPSASTAGSKFMQKTPKVLRDQIAARSRSEAKPRGLQLQCASTSQILAETADFPQEPDPWINA